LAASIPSLIIFFKAAQDKAYFTVVTSEPLGLIIDKTSSAKMPGALVFKVTKTPKNFCLSPTTTTFVKMGKAVLI